MSSTRRSFLALVALIPLSALNASAQMSTPEAIGTATLSVSAPSGITTTVTQSVTEPVLPPNTVAPPTHYNFVQSGTITSATLKTQNKLSDSKATSVVAVKLENTSTSAKTFKPSFPLLAVAYAQSNGKAMASASMGGAFVSALYIAPWNTNNSHTHGATATYVEITLDPGDEISYEGQNSIHTEIPSIGGPGGSKPGD
jgi:hypothetical protein